MEDGHPEDLKDAGNALLKAGDPRGAIAKYTQAIALEKNAVFYSNRAAAYIELKEFDSALRDAKDAVAAKRDYFKAYSHMAVALEGLGRIDEARAAYEAGIEVCPAESASTLRKRARSVGVARRSSKTRRR